MFKVYKIAVSSLFSKIRGAHLCFSEHKQYLVGLIPYQGVGVYFKIHACLCF